MANVRWKPDADGDWSVAANWNAGAVPVQGDDVTIATPDAHTVSHSGGTDTIAQLTVAGDTFALSAGTLAIVSSASFGGQLSVAGGVLLLGGNANAAGSYVQTNGTVSVAQGATLTLAGTAQFGPYGTGDIDGPGTLSTTGTTTVDEAVYIGAGLIWSNSGTVDDASNIIGGDPSGGTATLLNLAGASFDLTGDYLNVEDNGSTGNASQPVGTLTFVNQGVLAKTGGGGGSTIAVTLNNAANGTITSNSGELYLSGGGTFSGTINGTGIVDFNGGVSTVPTSLTATNAFNQTGGQIVVAQGATLTLAGTAQFGPYGTGDIDGPGTLSTTGTTTVDEAVYIGAGLIWSNSGTVDDASNILGGDPSGGTATLLNLAGASFDLTGDYLNVEDNGSTGNASQPVGTLTFVNQGILAKIAGGGGSTISVTLNNAANGTITSNSGELYLSGGGTFSGTINGTGVVDFNGGVSTVPTSLTATNAFNQTGGQIVVAQGATLTLAGAAQFGPYGTGDIDGPGTLSTTGTTTVDESLYVGAGLTWSNSSTIDDASNIIGGDPSGGTATLLNLTGASFDLTGDYLNVENNGNTGNASQPVGALIFVNQGVLAKTGGGGGSTISVTLNNAANGTITSNSGELYLSGGGTFSGTINGTGVVDFAGGVSTVASALTATNAFNQTGGQIVVAQGATLTLAGTAQFGPYGTGDIDGPGTLSTTGTTTVDEAVYIGAGLIWSNSGTVDDASNIIGGDPSGGTATLLNLTGASFDLTGDYLNVEDNGSTGNASQPVGTLIFVNQGILAKTGGGGGSTISVILNNAANGTITSNSGELYLSGGGTFSGTINGTGIVDFNGGVSTVATALTATNTFNQTGGQIVVAQAATLTLAGTAKFGPYGTGDIDGPGTLSTTGTTTVDEAVYIGAGLIWSNSGTIDDASNIIGGDPSGGTATLLNLAGASFDLTGDYLNVENNGNTGDASQPVGTLTFVNQGVLAKTGGGGGSTIAVTLNNTGTVQARDGTLLLSGGVNNYGVLQATLGGNLDVAGALTGPGDIVVDGGSKVEIGSATGEAVVFTGAGTLQLDAPAAFTGTIYGFKTGAQIVLGGAQVTGISLRGTELVVSLAGGGSYMLAIDGLQSTAGLSLANNVLTGTAALQSTTPDLVVTTVNAPAKTLAGEPTTITWTDTNHGAVAATGPLVDQLYAVSDAAGSNPQLVGSLEYDGTLSGGQSIDRSLDVTLPAATSGTDYFLVKTDALNQVAHDGTGPDRQDVSAAVSVIPTAVPVTPPSISRITPDSGSNLGSVTVTVDGAAFKADDQVALVAVGGTVLNATQVRYVDGGTLWATFDLASATNGTYSVRISAPTGATISPGAFTVNSDPAGQLSVNLVLPTTTQGTGTGSVTYTNTGATDIAAPILDVSSSQALLQGQNDTIASGGIEFLGTNPNGTAGILQPGASGTYSFTYTPTHPTALGDVSIAVGTTQSGATIDWNSLENQLRPPTVNPTDWNNVFTEFVARVGTTTDNLTAALDQDATELSQVGQTTDDITTLLQYELFQASGALAGSDLVNAADIAATSSSLSLSLGRSYDGTLLGRDATGAFGDGWTSSYDVTAVTDASGDVYIQAPGVLHVFTLQANGSYAVQAADPASLTLSGGLYHMNDGSGDVSQFNAAGKLASVTDANGNAVTMAYGSNGVLQTVAGTTTGETITFTSNAAGRITSATDSNGQHVTYTYNTAGTQLLSATNAAGITTYSYVAPTGSVQDNALASVTNPNGAVENFTYDAEGRLATQAGNGGTVPTTYSYPGAGEVTVTNALGNSTTLLYGADGTVAQTQDALGNMTQLASNAAGELTVVTTAGGNTYHYAYGATGNLTSSTDPLGGTIGASYAPGTQKLTDFTDQRGSQTYYTYNAAGNVTGITYQDGSGGIYQYNMAGLLTGSTDADGNTTTYGYDNAGDLTSKTFSGGTSDTYAYDAHGNLIAATASGEGTTSYTYDAANRLTSVTNPQGQAEGYTYNAEGELATRTEPDGSVTQDSYDALGRLTELQDGSGNLLDKYTYNAVGELVRTDTGNGAYSSYQYDSNGNVTEILDSNADGSIADRMDYTYNANGEVIENATSNGLWTYGYDASGELTSAVFQSINPATQNQNISYVYDSAGNRVSQTVNGVVTNYTTNALNQYTAVGGTTYTYDADGNVIRETDGSGTTTFTYSLSGQLTSETGPGGTYQYAYDAIGNLVSQAQNGVASRYIDDPLSLSVAGQELTSIAQVDDAAGRVEANYNYGLGLANTTDQAGNTSYFEDDLAGNVTGLTDPSGILSASFEYSPFGQIISSTGTDLNPFSFSGILGVSTLAGGLQANRARDYDPVIGRFTSEDPLAIQRGQNLYEYALNDPIQGSDPTGDFAIILLPIVVGAGGALLGAGSTFLEKGGTATLGDYLSAAAGGAAGSETLLFTKSPTAAAAANVAASNVVAGLYDYIAGEHFNVADAVTDAYFTFAFAGPAGKLEKTAFTNFASGRWKNVSGKTLSKIFKDNSFDALHDSLNKILVTGVSKLLRSLTHAIASLFRDPHLTTFDGLHYDFQTAGEFVLTGLSSGRDFAVEARISAPIGATSYSVITELGIQVGTDRVTIDSTRTAAVWVDGAPATFTSGVVNLADGQIIKMASGYRITLNTGESVNTTIDSVGAQYGPGTTSAGIDTVITLNPFIETPGTVEGLLGNANGDPTKDLTLADGTVLPTNMPGSELYGAYADAWRVTQATSLLDYAPGQTTQPFTDTGYPGTPVTIASFPQSAIQAATTIVKQLGITDPGLQQDAIYDYLVTGDPALLTTEERLQQQGINITASADPVLPTAGPEVGIIAAQTSETEATFGPTIAQFQVYRSGDTSAAATISYAVTAPDSTYVGAASFGGALPSGTVSFAAGKTSADLAITVTQSIGNVPSAALQVTLSALSPIDVIGQAAQVQIVNPAPVAGPPPDYAVELTSDEGVQPTVSGNTWTFDLGPAGSSPVTLAVDNTAATSADNLTGTVTATGDGAFTASTSNFSGLVPGAILNVAQLDPTSSSGTETLTFALQDTNSSGYTANLPTQTVIVSYGASDVFTIAGTQAAQATSDAVAIAPFANVTIGNPDTAASATATVVLSNAANGTFSNLGIGMLSAGGATYTVSGGTAAIQAALRALVFTPTDHEVAPGQTVSTGLALTVSDGTATASDSTTSVAATAVDVGPSISGSITNPQVTNPAQTTTPFGNVSIIDPDVGATETTTITLTANGVTTDLNGMLSGAGLTKTGIGTYQLAAAPPASETQSLEALVFNPAVPGGGQASASPSFSVQVSDGIATPVTVSNGGNPSTGGAGTGTTLPDVSASFTSAVYATLQATLASLMPIGSTPNVVSVAGGAAAGAPMLGTLNAYVVTTSGAGSADTVPAGYATGYLLGGPASLQDTSGNSLLIDATANSTLLGAAGDTLFGDNAGATLIATAGTETLFGGTGANLIELGASTALASTQGTDTIIGSTGSATINASGAPLFFGASGATLLNALGRSATLVGGGAGGETVNAGSSNTLVFGGAGPLTFNAGSGASTVVSGQASASITGGSGGLLYFGNGATTYTPGSAVDTVLGFTGSLTATGGANGTLFFTGTAGNNVVSSGSGSSTIFGFGASDSLTATGPGNDVIAATSASDTINGASSTGTNTFFAFGADDSVVGGAGATAIESGLGNHTLVAGSGPTLFEILGGTLDRSITIGNFVTGQDFIQLQGYAPGAGATALQSSTIESGSTVIGLGDGTQITFQGITNLSASSFL